MLERDDHHTPPPEGHETWRPRRGRTYNIIAWFIIIVFALSVLTMIAAILMQFLGN